VCVTNHRFLVSRLLQGQRPVRSTTTSRGALLLTNPCLSLAALHLRCGI
jgi:hypothetical protein